MGEEVLVDCTEGGVGGFHVAVDGVLLVERDDDEGDALVLGEVADVLVHGGVGGDGG